jgi:hypothetical protein
MRLDLYAWLTYRMSYLSRQTTVSWNQLMFQLGTNADTRSARHKFRSDVAKHLGEILREYPEARVGANETGITLRPSPPHVSRKGASRQLKLPRSSSAG